jgi:hypothetical protein
MTAIASPRRTVQALAVAAILAGVAGTAVSLMRGPPPAVYADPDAVLAREPYMGVACGRRLGCDRVGLEVALRRPAREVSATIAGRPLRMTGTHGATTFTGYLQRADIRDRLHVSPAGGERYWGIETAAPVVALRIAFADGSVARTALRTHLMPGWG